MTLSPYTHPSMPGTSYREYLDIPAPPPVPIDITADIHSAALEDAEGQALVGAIIKRKRLSMGDELVGSDD